MAIRLFLHKSGKITEILAKQNSLLAQNIKNSGIVGSNFGQCGFNLECGTCAVKISPEFEEAEIEEEMVLRSIGKDSTYRCACQVSVTIELNNSNIEIS